MNRLVNNASWIIGCKIVQNILSFVVSMMSARYLGPSNYGLITYATSVVAFILPFANLGLTNILVQELISEPHRRSGSASLRRSSFRPAKKNPLA